MSAPYIENLKPGESDDDVNPEGSLYFGVRDLSSRVNRASVNSIATFSKTQYRPTSIPGSTGTYFDVFNDALPESRPTATVDRSIDAEVPYDSNGDTVLDSTYGPVLLVEKAVSGEATERGVLFVEADISDTTPVGCEIQIGIQSYTTGASDYLVDATYAGVVAGFVYWPLNTGVFIFFKDDGGTLKVEVAGPAQDGAGTRLVSTTTDYDWSANLHAPDSIRVVLDPTSRLSKVFVFITSESDGEYTETLLFESSLEALGTLQPAARIGNFYAEGPPSKVVAFAGIDSGDAGDFVEIHSINVEEYGLFLLGSGSSVPTSTASRKPSDSTVVSSYSDTQEWDRTEVSDTVTESSTSFTLASEGTGNAGMYKEDSDLRNQRFLVVMQGSVRSPVHEGSFSTGAGIDIDDGSNVTSIRFLDDFSSYKIGLWSVPGSSLIDTNSFSAVDSRWSETTPEILVVADAAQGFCNVWISEDVDVAASSLSSVSIEQAYSTQGTRYSYPKMGVGFVDSDATSLTQTGSFTLSKLFVLPNFRAFVPHIASFVGALPSSHGWGAYGSGTAGEFSSGVDSVSNPVWAITPTSSSSYDYYSFPLTESTYLAGESGISVVAKIEVKEWTDQFGAVNSIRVPTCAIIAIDVGSGLFLQLQCLVSDAGEKYIFVSEDSQDYVEVLDQTEAGQKISALVDFTEAHTYLVSYRPGHGVQVFVDFAAIPVISLDWTEASSAHRPSSYLTAGQTASVGVIPYSTAGESADLELGIIGVSVGSGFDFSMGMVADDAILESSIYGAEANIFVDVSDED